MSIFGKLGEKDFGPEPLPHFTAWMKEAEAKAAQPNPNAMTLCTVGEDGWPQGRIVLLKAWGPEGLVFYTNSRSEKGRALAAHPFAEMVMHWDHQGRQLRLRGPVAPLSASETLAYFVTRPRGSRLAAWASDQSRPAASREELEEKLKAMVAEFEGKEVPSPPHWWGYRLQPLRVEFWQGGAFRFHDRFTYTRPTVDAAWSFTRLNP